MLCLDCGNGLRNTYQLMQKALESDIKLKEMKTEIIVKTDDRSTGIRKRMRYKIFVKP